MTFSLSATLFARIAACAILGFAGAPAFAEVPLATYRAVHDLVLDPSANVPELGTVSGRLVTEFTGSACAGYTTRSRFVTRNTDTEGERQVTDLRSTTYETADGMFEFVNENYSDEELADQSAGRARRGDDGIEVKLTKPGNKTFSLSRAIVFPTEQVTRILEAARAGERFVSFDLYDGSEAGESVFATATVIGPGSTSADDLGDETSVADAGFAGLRHWPVTISYFEMAENTDATPVYTMSLIIYDNGVPRDIKLDYGKFALVGRLSQLEMLPPAPCPG